MNAGFDLKEGKYGKVISEEQMWSSLSYFFSSRSKNSTSYKFGFFKAILDNLYNVDEQYRLSFDLKALIYSVLLAAVFHLMWFVPRLFTRKQSIKTKVLR